MRLDEIEEINELNMSTSALKSFLGSANASGIRFGFEAELLIPDLEPSEEEEFEPNIEDYDEPVNTSSLMALQDDLENFFSDTTSRIEIQREIDRVNEDIFEFMDKEFQQYLDSNQGQEDLRSLVSDAIGSDDEDEIEQEIENETRDYERVIDEMRDDFYGTWDNLDGALEDLDLLYMSNWHRYFDFPWPHYSGGAGGDVSFDEFAERLADDLDIKIRTGSSYKSVQRDNVSWIMEPDPSIEGDYAGAEIISPPMDINTGLEKMREFFNWMQEYGAKTNRSTGLHVGVSLPEDQMKNVDWLKVIVLLGDKYVLEQFGRLSNNYTGSALNKIQNSIRSNSNDVFPLLAQMKTGLSAASKTLMDRYRSRDKYTSVNIKDNYVEFRSMGGDYINRLNEIENMVLRYARVLSVAADPNEAKDEYAKKLYKLIDQIIGKTEFDDTIKIFSMMSSAKMPKAAAKSYIKQIQQQRQQQKNQPAAQSDSDLPLWDLVDYEGNVVHQVRAANRQEASRIGLDWARRNNQVISGIKRATSNIANSNDDLIDIRDVYANEAIEPDEPGYQHDVLTMPANTLVIDTPGELDWYKIGQHFPTLNQQDPHEYGQSESDMIITFANEKEKDLFIKLANKIGLKIKDIGGSAEHPEIHSESWSKKYKKSIDCNNPKGFSQKAHCAGRKARS